MSDADDFMTRYLNNITSQYESSRFKPEYEPAEPETTKVTCRDGVELTATSSARPTPARTRPRGALPLPAAGRAVEAARRTSQSARLRDGVRMVPRAPTPPAARGNRNVNERNDGADLLAWCEHQDWIDVIGLWGTSYLSLTCWTVADITTPKVASICANHYAPTGSPPPTKRLLPLRRAHRLGHAERGYPVDADYMKSALHLPQMSVDEDMWGGRLDWYRDWISHPRTPTPTGMRDSGDCSSPSPPRSRCRCSSTRLV